MATAPGFDFMSFAPIIVLMGAFYFLLIRPQQKKAKDHMTMLSGLRRGDEVATAGGIIGTITKVVDDNEILVEISKGVNTRVLKSTVTGRINYNQTESANESGVSEAIVSSSKKATTNSKTATKKTVKKSK